MYVLLLNLNSEEKDITTFMQKYNFELLSNSIYIYTGNNPITQVYLIIDKLKSSYLKECIEEIKYFKIDDLSDLTSFIKE